MDDEYLSQSLTQQREDDFEYAMPMKRKYARKSYASAKRYKRGVRGKTKSYVPRLRGTFAKSVMRVVNKCAETKTQMTNQCTNLTLWHNTVTNITDNVFFTSLGNRGSTQVFNIGSRNGKAIFVKGLKISMNLESQQYRPQVNYWLYLIRNREEPNTKIDTKAKVFEGVQTTIPCDYVDTEKVHILWCKKMVLRMPNTGVNQPMQQSADGVAASGFANKVYLGEDYEVFTNPQMTKKFYIPVNKKITYMDEADASDIPTGNCRYQLIAVAYDNYTTFTGAPGSGGYPCGHITLTTKLLFTDV